MSVILSVNPVNFSQFRQSSSVCPPKRVSAPGPVPGSHLSFRAVKDALGVIDRLVEGNAGRHGFRVQFVMKASGELRWCAKIVDFTMPRKRPDLRPSDFL